MSVLSVPLPRMTCDSRCGSECEENLLRREADGASYPHRRARLEARAADGKSIDRAVWLRAVEVGHRREGLRILLGRVEAAVRSCRQKRRVRLGLSQDDR